MHNHAYNGVNSIPADWPLESPLLDRTPRLALPMASHASRPAGAKLGDSISIGLSTGKHLLIHRTRQLFSLPLTFS